MTKETIKQIKAWLADFNAMRKRQDSGQDVDNDTFEGDAYYLFKRILEEAK